MGWFPFLTFSAVTAAATLILKSTLLCDAQLHFASIGNWGSGSQTQHTVATTLKSTAKKNKLSFVVSPGSNFISGAGVTSLTDSIWSTHFNDPFKGPELYLPFFTVLGSQDWRGNFSALIDKNIQEYSMESVALTNVSSSLGPRWTLPNWWYHYSQHFQDASDVGPLSTGVDASVGFVFIDTYILSDKFLYQNITKKHWDNLRDTLTLLGQIFDWTIVVGDTALISSGASKGDQSLRKTLGQFLKETHVDAYISGNDYNMEIIKDGNLTHINCGSGSGADSSFRSKVKGSLHYVAKPGFCHHKLTKLNLVTEFIDGHTGKTLFTYTQGQVKRIRSLFDRFHLYKTLPDITFIPVPPFGRSTRPREDDWFIQVFGTIGFLIVIYVTVIGGTTIVQRSIKV